MTGDGCQQFGPNLLGHAVEVEQLGDFLEGGAEAARLHARHLRLRPAQVTGNGGSGKPSLLADPAELASYAEVTRLSHEQSQCSGA